jgi:hypothetical protein
VPGRRSYTRFLDGPRASSTAKRHRRSVDAPRVLPENRRG